jgi:hypothetical protein
LVRVKIMVNENHFRFDRKTFFNFWKTIYGFKNRKSFFEIKLFVLTCMFDMRLLESSNGQSSESGNIQPPKYCRRRNPATSGHGCRRPAETGWNPATVRSRPDLAKMAGFDRIRPLIPPDLDGSGH